MTRILSLAVLAGLIAAGIMNKLVTDKELKNLLSPGRSA